MMELQVRMFQTLLERKINQRGYTQFQVEEALSWDKGTIAQLLAGEEELRVRQILAILGVLGVESKAFFAELYGLAAGDLSAELAELRTLVGSVVNLLVEKGAVTADAVASAVAAQVSTPR